MVNYTDRKYPHYIEKMKYILSLTNSGYNCPLCKEFIEGNKEKLETHADKEHHEQIGNLPHKF